MDAIVHRTGSTRGVVCACECLRWFICLSTAYNPSIPSHPNPNIPHMNIGHLICCGDCASPACQNDCNFFFVLYYRRDVSSTIVMNYDSAVLYSLRAYACNMRTRTHCGTIWDAVNVFQWQIKSNNIDHSPGHSQHCNRALALWIKTTIYLVHFRSSTDNGLLWFYFRINHLIEIGKIILMITFINW